MEDASTKSGTMVFGAGRGPDGRRSFRMDIANATSLKRKNRSMATNYDSSSMLRFREAAAETPIR